jgi:hypothetical protein
MVRSRRSNLARADFSAMRPLAIVVIAHVDTGPMWYQWVCRAGHHAWLCYGTDPAGMAERLVRETSPDLLLVHATSADDPGWARVRAVRERFPHARLPVIAVVDDLSAPPDANVVVLPQADSAWSLLTAIDAAMRPGSWIAASQMWRARAAITISRT